MQTWVLGAADSYAHFATLPIGLWALAAFIELAERSLPVASLVRPDHSHDEALNSISDGEQSTRYDSQPSVVTPTT